MCVVLASWNVHGWVGSDGRRQPARALEAIRQMDADVVALQEVQGTDWEAQAEAAGYRVVLGRTQPLPFGNALLARVPITRVARLDLSVAGREPRGALDVVVSPDATGPLRVIATHLGLRAAERRLQAAWLSRHLEQRERHLPRVLIGDLNDWTPWAAQLRVLTRSLGPFSRLRTFPSARPVLALDRAAWRVPGWMPRLRVVRSDRVRHASDHLPLKLELRPTAADPERG